jgi:hypothetical protein
VKSWLRNALEKVRCSLLRIFHSTSSSTRPVDLTAHPAADQLRLIIIATKEQAENAQVKSGNIGAGLQKVIDDAEATLPLVPYMNSANIEENAILWGEAYKQAEHIYHWLEGAESDTDVTSGTTSLSTTTTIGIFSQEPHPFSADPSFNNAWGHYIEVTNRPALKDDVVNLILAFHLDTASGGKQSTYELFQIAHSAFEAPVTRGDPAITSLIPMREAVESAIDELVRLRPHQEPTGSSYPRKILSIGAQLKKDIVSDLVIQQWADQWHDISDRDLSVSKRHQMTREEWNRKLNRATQFLHSFLTGLDPTKLRN